MMEASGGAWSAQQATRPHEAFPGALRGKGCAPPEAVAESVLRLD